MAGRDTIQPVANQILEGLNAEAFARLVADAVSAALSGSAPVLQLMSATQACRRLGLGRDKFRSEVRAGKIHFAMIGRRRKFTQQDLADYQKLAREQVLPCPSINPKRRRITTTTSSTGVIDIAALLEQKMKKLQKR
jgi:excisionase family DNA binding protein